MMPTTGDQDGDDQSGGGNSSSTASPVPVTQADHDNIDITDEVAQHIKERYSDDPGCELFDSICGHSWDNGVLMLRIKWKTDEESTSRTSREIIFRMCVCVTLTLCVDPLAF
jgi:hypothetical protein